MITCPKCHYKRTAADTGPDWQCPKCGVVYAKANARARDVPSKPMASELSFAEAQHNPVPRLLLIGAAVLLVGFLGYSWLSKPKAGTASGGAAAVPVDVAAARSNLRVEAAEAFLQAGAYDKALPELNALAAEKNPLALFHLARLHSEGRGVAKDLEKSVALFTQAANLGNAMSEVALGNIYQNGVGVTKAYGPAASWFRRAARGGDASGLYCLGNLYARGFGVDQNLTMAYMLFEMAGEAQKTSAHESRQRSSSFATYGCSPGSYSSGQFEIKKNMSLVQVQRAKDLAKTWNFDQPLPE